MSETITVALAARAYDVHVGSGLLQRCAQFIGPLAHGVVPIVTDSTVAPLYLETLSASLSASGLKVAPIILRPGEETKSFSQLESLCSSLLKCGVDRNGLIIALGGGVIGDLTGFAAGIFKRGVAFAQIPTTLLAQVDSSVGGKTAINMAEGKNLAGLFHQPKIVLADTDVLKTLPNRELLAGYAEVAKYGALGDRSFFDWLEANANRALLGSGPEIVYAVAHAVRMKAAIVARDELETGERVLLNLGHTFGHALEAATGYSNKILHGESVAIGMALAFRLSVKLGYCPDQDSQRFIAHLASVGLPTSLRAAPRVSVELLLEHMAHDKKVKDGTLTFILVRGIGRAFASNDVPLSAVRSVLTE